MADFPGRPLEEAIAVAVGLAPAGPAERVPMAALAGRRLARAVVTRAPVPPFTHSAMDGWAVRAADTPGALRTSGESRAGDAPARLEAGRARRISTGAPIPEGADAVVRQEHARLVGDVVHVDARVAPGRDVRRAGEDAPAGATVLESGALVAPHHVGVVAAAGHETAWCHPRLRVAILGTGSELIPPGGRLAPGAVFDSNRHAVAAQAEGAGAEVHASAHVDDDAAVTARAIGRLLDGDGEPPDVLVTIGGVSVGPHDHVRPALAAHGVREVIPGLSARPGQPTRIGVRGSQVVLSLPGNPVSAIICFHVLGRPLLGAGDPFTFRLPLAADVVHARPHAGLVRCRLTTEGTLLPLPRQGSADVGSLGDARAIAWIPAGAAAVHTGATVRASLLW